MRATYRSHGGNKDYWQSRWEKSGVDTGELNFRSYPGLYADAVMREVKGTVLEAGCGAGRVLRHYHALGATIIGMDFIHDALRNLREVDGGLLLTTADIMNLPLASESLEGVLAFGLYHNLEKGIDQALRETRRVLIKGGFLCASMRADNLQNRILDYTNDKNKAGQKIFHKMNYTDNEVRAAIKAAGFEVLRVEYVQNMPFLYKVPFLRHPTHREFSERRGRAEGYRLSPVGTFIQRALMRLWPSKFCNIFVVTARAI